MPKPAGPRVATEGDLRYSFAVSFNGTELLTSSRIPQHQLAIRFDLQVLQKIIRIGLRLILAALLRRGLVHHRGHIEI